MQSIQIDFDVFKALTLRRETEAVTYNDVLRALLGLPASPTQTVPGATAPPEPRWSGGGWTVKGVRFPVGTEFRAQYKGATHTGQVVDGALVVGGRQFDSPSAAAVSITGSAVNGWVFWECRLPGESAWQLISRLRSRKAAG